MTLRLDARTIIATMIGAADTPFSTALQNRALIGSSPDQSSATPMTVAPTMIE